jgi:hypothetical protein
VVNVWCTALCVADASYDYAVPELSGSAPLLGPDASATLPRCSDRDSMFSRASSSNGGPPLIMTSSRVSEDSGSRATGKKVRENLSNYNNKLF